MGTVTHRCAPNYAINIDLQPSSKAPPQSGSPMGNAITVVRSAARKELQYTVTIEKNIPQNQAQEPLVGGAGRTSQSDRDEPTGSRDAIKVVTHSLSEHIVPQLERTKNSVKELMGRFAKSGEVRGDLSAYVASPLKTALTSVEIALASVKGLKDQLERWSDGPRDGDSTSSPRPTSTQGFASHTGASHASVPCPPTPEPRGDNIRSTRRPNAQLGSSVVRHSDKAGHQTSPHSPPKKGDVGAIATEAATFKEIPSISKQIPAPAVWGTRTATSHEIAPLSRPKEGPSEPSDDDRSAQMLAYADLNSIFEAFLASEGKKIIPNPGEGNNCAIYALLQPLYPDLEIDELDKEVALLRAEYDELYPSDSTKRLHLDGSSGSSIDALIDIVNKRYDKNIRVQVVSAGFSPEYPCTEYGIFPKDEKILRPGRPSHDLIIYDQQGHYVAVVDRELVAHHDEPG